MNIESAALEFKKMPAFRKKTEYIVLHHAAASNATVQQVHQWHLSNGWLGIGYHYYVAKNGTVYYGRPDTTIGAHSTGTPANNYNAIGICFEGNFEVDIMLDEQLKAGVELIKDIQNYYGELKINKHKDNSATACPGKNFPFEEMVELAKDGTVSLISVVMNGVKTKMKSIIHKDENYIRIRDLADAQTDDKLTVNWDKKNKQVVITSK